MRKILVENAIFDHKKEQVKGWFNSVLNGTLIQGTILFPKRSDHATPIDQVSFELADTFKTEKRRKFEERTSKRMAELEDDVCSAEEKIQHKEKRIEELLTVIRELKIKYHTDPVTDRMEVLQNQNNHLKKENDELHHYLSGAVAKNKKLENRLLRTQQYIKKLHTDKTTVRGRDLEMVVNRAINILRRGIV